MDVTDLSVFPHPFDWGISRPGGWRTLFLTALAYGACVGVSLSLLRHVRRRGRPMLASVVGVLSLIPMIGLAGQSVLIQLVESRSRGTTHETAVAVIGMAFLVVIGVWLFTEVVTPRSTSPRAQPRAVESRQPVNSR
jgi:hypothetical protein